MVTRLARARRPSLLRLLCAATVLLLTAAGCTQSLFDSNPGDRDGGGDGDGDGDGDAPDAGADAAPVAACPEPCAGDAFAEFSADQGGTNGRWGYFQDVNAANGAAYVELGYGAWNGVDAWSAGDSGPAIATCRDSRDPACAGLSDFVLLIPGPAGAERPALTFRVPENAAYRLSGAARVADGAALDVPVQLLVSRGGRHDAIAVQAIRTSESEVALDALVPGIAGDDLILSVGSDEDAPPLGVRVFFTRVDDGDDAFPGSCQIALRFDPGDPLTDRCRGVEVDDRNDDIGPPGTSTAGPGPSDRLGDGRVLAEGQYLVVGNSPLDYSGDFTIQFWARLDHPQPSFNAAVFVDWSDVASSTHGGQGFIRDDDTGYTEFCYYTQGASARTCLDGTTPIDAEWHFWRAVRSTEGGTYQICIDGVEFLQTPISGDANMTSDEQPRLGRNIVFEPAYFSGSLDEVRVFAEALPCRTDLP